MPAGIEPENVARQWSYESVAWCYDVIAAVYSLGRIAHAKAWSVGRVQPGERVLFVGIGAGEDALLAAHAGAQVSGLDLAPAMLRRTARRFERAQRSIEVVHCDLFDFDAAADFEVVVLNFFLNVYDAAEMERALEHALSLLAPGGCVVLADFAPLPTQGLRRVAAALYYWPVAWAGALLGLAALHPPYDYAPSLARLGYQVVERERFSLFAGAGYEVLTAQLADR
jgi:ubiquinone/menaquinone biosynthesis C-methylase UbiE